MAHTECIEDENDVLAGMEVTITTFDDCKCAGVETGGTGTEGQILGVE